MGDRDFSLWRQKAGTGFSSQIIVVAVISAMSSAEMLISLCVAAFARLAGRYDAGERAVKELAEYRRVL
jgi:hypothetical protein